MSPASERARKKRAKKTASAKKKPNPKTTKEVMSQNGLQEKLAQYMQALAKQKNGSTDPPEFPPELEGVPPELILRQFDIGSLLDGSRSPQSRAEMLLLVAAEVGNDIMPALAQLIARLDQGTTLGAKVQTLTEELAEAKRENDAHPLGTEVFLEKIERTDSSAAVILTQQGERVCPIAPTLPDVERGDRVLLDLQNGVVVDRVAGVAATGEVVSIEHVDHATKQVTVRKHEMNYTAHLSKSALESSALEVGATAVWDPARHFVHRILAPEVDGSDLLAAADTLSDFTLANLGSPNPAIFEIVDQAKQVVTHPEWSQSLGLTRRRSYLFWGPTGTGKTSSIRVIVNLIADWVESLTGVREPRLVFGDASDFYSPYMGEGEQKINRWFEKLYCLAREERTTLDGRRIRLPLVVVLEEIEGLIRSRGEQGGSSHLFERMLGLILQKMDSAEQDTDMPIIFITTSNRKELIDAAAKRRFGDREVHFPYLDAREALAVLQKKIPNELPLVDGNATKVARDVTIRGVLFFLFGDTEDQAVAEVVLRDSKRVSVNRRDLVSGSILTSAVERAKDRAMAATVEAGALRGMAGADVVDALRERYVELVRGLTPHNLAEHVPHLFEGQSLSQVVSVQPISHSPH